MLLSHFAPVLIDEKDLRITYSGTALDPVDEVDDTAVYPQPFIDDAGQNHDAALRIIEWDTVKHRAIYYGKDEEHFVYEEPAIDVETRSRYSAYVTWAGLDHDALSVIGSGDMTDAPVGALWIAPRKGIREHFGSRRRKRRHEQVERGKADKVYPFEGEAQSETEKAERAIFDVVAGTIGQQVPARKDSARVTLGLLRIALRQDPEQLGVLFNEVASLSRDDRDSLTSAQPLTCCCRGRRSSRRSPPWGLGLSSPW